MGKNIISEGERQNSSVPFSTVTRAEKNLAWLTPVILWESFTPGVLACSRHCPLERHSGTIFFISLSFKSELLIAIQTHCNLGLAAPLSMPLPVLVIPFFFTPLVAIYPSKPYSDTNITKVSSLVLHPLQLPSMN